MLHDLLLGLLDAGCVTDGRSHTVDVSRTLVVLLASIGVCARSGFTTTLSGVVALAKSVGDRAEGIPVSGLFLGLHFAVVTFPVVVLVWMLWQSPFPHETSWRVFITATLMVFVGAAV